MSFLLDSRARALTFLGLAYLAYAYVAYRLQWDVPVCVFHLLTGIPCPLCGLTHSVGATLNGHILFAVRLHILGPAFVIAICCMAVSSLMEGLQQDHSLVRQPD